ncbi:hypothetical protein [Undibacterium curvum]|uniref:hypothetical protein n=1 Tax=Undibacterium curvum TaxID=2762294 RepID=UPI003D13C1FC
MKTNPFEALSGKTVIDWLGCELALIPGEDGKASIWVSALTPYRQFFELEIICTDGSKFNIESRYDEDGYFELALKANRKDIEHYVPTKDDFVRVLNLNTFPKGKVNFIDVVLDQRSNIVALKLAIGNSTITLESGFVAQKNDTFIVQRPEDFVIINTSQTVTER